MNSGCPFRFTGKCGTRERAARTTALEEAPVRVSSPSLLLRGRTTSGAVTAHREVIP